MSYSTVSEVGAAAVINDVKFAAEYINEELGYDGLWDIGSWLVRPNTSTVRNSHFFDLGYNTMEITSVEYYIGARTEPTWTYSTVTTYPEPTSVWEIPDTAPGGFPEKGSRIRFTGTRGNGKLGSALSAGQPLVAGQSVLRAGAVSLIEADAVSQAGDRVISPPAGLNTAAIRLAIKSMYLKRDFSSEPSEVVETVVKNIIGRYRK